MLHNVGASNFKKFKFAIWQFARFSSDMRSMTGVNFEIFKIIPIRSTFIFKLNIILSTRAEQYV